MNYTHRNSKNQKRHWEQCERQQAPYIEISDINETYKNVFYDITNLAGDLEEISEAVKAIYTSYVAFYLVPQIDIEHLFEQYYFFNLIVKSAHAEIIAEQLHCYLSAQLNGQ
ncbi:hypothetical protein [Pseudomonas sp. 2835]|uniref:hypothetical protein n=1 Tax=Pseudomonas sp. 2835 TaxID=3156451 RepID=UPI003D21BD14